MSVAGEGPQSACPPPTALERFVQEPDQTSELALHIGCCAECRATLEEIRDNNRFLAEAGPALRRIEHTGCGDIAPNDVVPGFEDVREIYRGGQGIVYRAYHRATKRTVAIKLLLQGSMATRSQRERFEREIEIAASLDHPGIVTLYETYVPPSGRAGYVMEHVDGLRLDRWVLEQDRRRGERRPAELLRERVELCRKISSAIAYAHEHGVIHRDLKPANVLVDARGEPHVLDFGLARTTADSARSVTATGELVGTFAYVAPEQLAGDPNLLDTRTDVYALGVLLYEVLTGEHPYGCVGSFSDLIRAETAELTPPSQYEPAIDAELETIMLMAVAREPGRRYAFAGALADDLGHYLAGEPIDAKRDSQSYLLRKALARHQVGASVAVAFVALITVFAIAMTVKARQLRDQLASNSIEQARALVAAGNIPVAEDLLWPQLFESASTFGSLPAALERDPLARRAYWALWELYAAHPCLWSAMTQGRFATSLAATAGGELLAIGCADGSLELRDGRSGELLADWGAHAQDVVAACFDPGGARLATGAADGSIHVWRVEDRERTRVLSGHDAGIHSLAFDARGSELLSADNAGTFKRWDLIDGSATTIAHEAGPGLVERSGRWIASSGPDGVELGDWQGERWSVSLDAPSRPPRARLDLSPSGEFLGVTRGYRGEIRAVPSGSLLVRLPGSVSTRITFSERGSLCATTGVDRRIHLWKILEEGVLDSVATLSGHRAVPRLLAFSGGVPGLLFAVDGDVIKCWQTAAGSVRALSEPLSAVHTLAYSADGSLLAMTGESGAARVELRDAQSFERLALFEPSSKLASALAFEPSGERILVGDQEGVVHVWDWSGAAPSARLEGHQGAISALCVSRDGSLAVSASDDRTIRIWQLPSSTCRAVLRGHENRIPSLALLPDGRRLVSASKDGTIRLWSLDSGRQLGTLAQGGPPVRALAVSPDGRLLASGDDAWNVRLWDLTRRQPIATLTGHAAELYTLAFHPDGELLASAGVGPEVMLWDVRSPARLATIETELANVFSLAFLPDGQALAIGGDGGPSGVLDLTSRAAHIAGNVGAQIERLGAQGRGVRGAEQLRRWARAWTAASAGE